MDLKKWFVAWSAVMVFGAFLFLSNADAAAYTYQNESYGFSIVCPQEPVGVVELSTISPEETGIVLIFENDGYNIQYAWVVSNDGFDEKALPDFEQLSEEQVQNYIGHLIAGSAYEMARVVKVNGQSALYAVTKGDAKQVGTYFRANGKRYAVTLAGSAEITKEKIEDYQNGILSFKTL